jgi:Protein of unknown function (DUF3631)
MEINTPSDCLQTSTLTRLEDFFRAYLNLPDGLHLVLALWTLATYCPNAFDCFPYLSVSSPQKRCGKSRLMELLAFVVQRPLLTVAVSPAALYRTLQHGIHCLLVDEAESLGNPQQNVTIREILNSGFRKGSYVVRCESVTRSKKTKAKGRETSRQFIPTQLPVYGPKAIALIGRPQGTIADRCIEVAMQRNGSGLARFRHRQVSEAGKDLSAECASWAEFFADDVRDFYDGNDLDFLQDREAELWNCLWATCNISDAARLPELKTTALRLSGAKMEGDDDHAILLLRELLSLFFDLGGDGLHTETIVIYLNASKAGSWSRWNKGKGLDGVSLAKVLKGFGITPRDIRIGSSVRKGYLVGEIMAACDRYNAWPTGGMGEA